ncbi:MAG: DsbA family protein, partial [Candidatus Aenigmatarchaeota archaeon]
PKLNEDYIKTGQVKFVFINYAFLGQDSTEAAVAAECVYNQDKQQFWDFHKSLYDNQGAEHSGWVTPDLVMSIARNSTEGLDYNQLQSCINTRATSGAVNSDNQVASSHGVTGTPTIFVNGKKINQWNNYNALKAAIEAELP